MDINRYLKALVEKEGSDLFFSAKLVLSGFAFVLPAGQFYSHLLLFLFQLQQF